MKKYISLILLTIAPAWMFAEPIDSLDAKQVATAFMHNLSEQSGAKSVRETNYKCKKDRNIYILNDANGGWAIVSTDDCVRPILAYSPDGEFSIDNISPAAKAWIDSYNEQIEIVQKNSLKRSANVSKEWEQLRNGDIRRGTTQYVVEPLIKTKWAQSPRYNKHCPTINGNNTVTGCVATAMAQVMNYWQWPIKGMGFHEYKSQNCGTVASIFGWEYDWNDMPEQLNDKSPEKCIDAVSDLMYDCGVSVDMNYDLGESGINKTEKVKDAMVKYFKYSPNMTLEHKDNYEEEMWIDKLKEELNNKRPILYYGYGDDGKSGHAFICDGYAIDNSYYYFHFNWGWSGSGDGYFYSINSLEPIDTEGQTGSNSYGTYNANQQAYFGIEPLPDIKEYDLRVYDGDLLAYDQNGSQINTLWLGNDVYYRAKIVNYGDIDFSGTVAVAIFDEDDRFVTISNEVYLDLQSDYHTTNEVEFKIDGTFGYATDKQYFAVALYKDNQTNDWTIVSDNWFYSSKFEFNVNYSADISINSAITVFDNYKKEEVTTQEFIKGDEYTFTVSIINTGENNYVGDYLLSLINAKGEFVQKIDTYTQSQPLKPNEIRSIMFQDTIDVEPGTYLLNVSFWNGDGWTLSGAVNGSSNPIFFDVKEEYLPDEYEDNNTLNNAYVFPLEYDADNSAFIMTLSNLHKHGDIDFYKFDLGRGYNYTIDATIVNNNDELVDFTMTADNVSVEYSYDGKKWFKGHDYEYRCKHTDDDRCDNLTINGAGTVYVKIYHPWGIKGTYIFAADIERTPITYRIVASAKNGTVSGASTYNYGASAILTATPNNGYHFVKWSDGNTDNPRTVTVNGDLTFTAIFEADENNNNENQGGNNEGENENQGGNNEGGNESQVENENNPATVVAESAAIAVNIYVHGNTIIIENATEEIRVYNAMGALVGRDVARNVSTIRINNPGVYIVKTGNTVKRVMVN